jgi:hypothetical protein
MEIDRNTAILQTFPDSKYAHLVNEIVNDKMSGGNHNLYKDYSKTSYDIMAGYLQKEQDSLNLAVKLNRKKMDKIIDDITNALKDPKDKDYKKATDKEVKAWEEESLKLQEDYVRIKGSLDTMAPKLADVKYNQYVEIGQKMTMWFLRNKFIDDGDLEYLEKGVTWASDYAEKNRLSLDLAYYKSFYP